MMNVLEKEIIEKFQQLEPSAQQRVREIITQEEVGIGSFDFAAWSREVEAIRQEIQIEHGGQQPTVDVVDMLRGIRDGEDE